MTMYDYVHELIKNVPQWYIKSAGEATSDPDHLYTVRDSENNSVDLLDTKRREEYHSLTAQYLYFSKRGRPDLQTSIVFHCTWVRCPNEDDKKKLWRILLYLDKTKHLPLILAVDDKGVIEWWVDTVFAVYDNMKSRTGRYEHESRHWYHIWGIFQTEDNHNELHPCWISGGIRCSAKSLEHQGFSVQDM